MNKKRKNLLPNLYIVIMLIVALAPIYWMFNTSLKNMGEIYSGVPTLFPKTPTLESYKSLFADTNFLVGIKNSMIIAFSVSIFSILVAYPVSYTLARRVFKGKQIYSRAILFMYLLPSSVLYIPLYILVSRLGLTNSLAGLILIYPTFTLPYVAWILIPHIQSISKSIEEAAHVDGASQLTIMYKIIFPLALPGIVSTTIFTFAMVWGEYLYALVNITSKRMQTFPLVLSGLIFGDMYPWGQLMAGAIVASIPILIVYLLASSSIVSGGTDGGVKL